MERLESIEDVCEVRRIGPAGLRPSALFELPHGATRAEDFRRLRNQLEGPLPDDLEAFFFVNTDVGSWEVAVEAAARLAEPVNGGAARASLVVRSLIPRTFIDCNRVPGNGATGPGLTPLLPDYVRNPNDGRLLTERYNAYQQVARAAFEAVCGAGGLGVMLHTYAPKSVDVGAIDERVVEKLRAAYATPDRWPDRPRVETIDQDGEGRPLADEGLIAEIGRRFAEIGETLARNQTYRLYPDSAGHHHAARWPGRTVVIEFNRGQLAEPFSPFEEMQVPRPRAGHWAAPLADAIDVVLDTMAGPAFDRRPTAPGA